MDNQLMIVPLKDNEKIIESKRGKNPKSLANLKPWKPGESGNVSKHFRHGPQLTRLAREFLDSINPKSGESYAKEFVRKIADLAYNGDPTAMKIMWNYVEGMPKITAEITNKTEVDTGLEFLKNLIEEQRNNNEPPIIPPIQDK